MDSLAIGKYVLPFMEKLVQRVPNLEAALLCSSDGFNVCSVGVSQAQIGKLSALTSTLLSIGEATMTSLLAGTETSAVSNLSRASSQTSDLPVSPLDTLILEAGGTCLVGVKLHTSSPLNLIAAVQKTALGVVLMAVRTTAKEMTEHLLTKTAGTATPAASAPTQGPEAGSTLPNPSSAKAVFAPAALTP